MIFQNHWITNHFVGFLNSLHWEVHSLWESTMLSIEKRASHQFSGHIPIIFRYICVPNYCFSREKNREDVFNSFLKKWIKGEILICLGLIAHKRGPRWSKRSFTKNNAPLSISGLKCLLSYSMGEKERKVGLTPWKVPKIICILYEIILKQEW